MSTERFWWGAGASSVVTDGLAPASELARWKPADGGAGDGWTPETFAHLAGSGLGHLRVTLEWARIEPTDGRVDDAAVEAQRRVLADANDAGLEVWACLHDDTLPGWFAHDERGFADARSRRYHWARHVERVGELFGDLVHGWVPIFEPNRWAYRGWITARRPPGGLGDARGFAEALEGALLASVEAALRLRSGGRPVATAQWMVPLFPARPDPATPASPEAQAMTSVVDRALFGSWHRMLTEDTLTVGHRAEVDVPGARSAFDVIGFTYRHAAAVRGDGMLLAYPSDRRVGPSGHAAWGHGFGLTIHHLADAFPGTPLLAVAVPAAGHHDADRDDFVREIGEIAQETVADGVDLRGLWWDGPLRLAPPAPR